jgi:APA family basic amino acid/polyamine antiporter
MGDSSLPGAATLVESLPTNAGSPRLGEATYTERAHLERNHLSLWKVAAFGLVYMQVGPSMAMSAGALIAFSAQAAWLSNLLSVAVLSLLSVVISAYARRYVVTGSLVSYAYEALGARARLLVAACMMLGYVALTAALILGVVVFTSSALLDLGVKSASSTAWQCASSALISLLAACCACLGIDVSVRFVVILGFLCVPFVILAMAAAFVQLHPAVTMQFSFETVSLRGIIQGAVAATGYYVGFDGIAALAVETKEPKRNVPLVLVGTVLIIGAAITASCFVQYPLLLNHADELAAGASPVAIFAHAIGWDWLAIVVDVLLVLATLAATVTLYNIGARIIATTSADGLLPARLGRVHARFHTPVVAVGALAITATSLTVALQAILKLPPLMSSVYLSNLMTYYWLAPYLVVCVGILRVLRREGTRDIPTTAAAWLSMAAIAYVAVEMFRSPIDAGTTYLPYIAVVTIAVVVLAFLFTRHDANVSEIEVEEL